MGSAILFLKLHWPFILAIITAAAEFLLRIIPTKSDKSILNFIVRILDYLVKNKAVYTAGMTKKQRKNHRFKTEVQ